MGEFENQKCFFLVGGLPEVVTAGEPEADKGLLGRLTIDIAFSALAEAENNRVAVSAVLGRSGGLSTSRPVGELTSDIVRGVGLAAIEFILPDTEWPRMVEQLPSVSEEIKESGLGIISTRSAKPTRSRGPGMLSLRRGDDGGERLPPGVDD